MKRMPTSIHADPCNGTGDAVEIPAISRIEFGAKLAEIAGRPLTAEETARADKMAAHNWTLRVVATELFGEATVDRFFAPK